MTSGASSKQEKCDTCGKAVERISPAQSEYVTGKTFRLPFTDICLTIYHDESTIQHGCLDCIIDLQNDRQREVFDAGFNAGVQRVYERGFDD